MRIAAVGDIHCPRFLPIFERSLREIETPDVFLLAGDIVNRGKISEYPVVVNAIDSVHGHVPIIACFGNEDIELYTEDQIIELVGNRVKFADDLGVRPLSIRGSTLAVIGVSILNEKADDLETLKIIFADEVTRISRLLKNTSKGSGHSVILSHYSPLMESETKFSWWFEEAMKETKKGI